MQLNIMKLIISLTLLGAACFLSCSDSDEWNPIAPTLFDTPRVDGFYITGNSPDILGYWGFPSNSETLQSVFNYPNPFNPKTFIRFALPRAGHVKVWVVRAIGPGEDEGDLVKLFEAGFIKPRGAPLEILYDGIVEQAGDVEIEWHAGAYPDGFYCYYVATAGGHTQRRFALLWRGHSGNPFDYVWNGRWGIKENN